MERVCHCSCSHDRQSSSVLSDSTRTTSIIWSREVWILRGFYGIVRLIATAISKLLTFCFAIVGAFSGAIAGALAGWASNRGIILGAVLVAIAGASISVEFLDALRKNWCSNCSSSCSLSSMTKLLQRLLHQRLADEQLEQFLPVTSNIHLIQVNRLHLRHGEMNGVHTEVPSIGLSEDSIKNLPCHVESDKIRAAQEACCTICLQDIAVGDIARSLPQCHHTFHLTCVDKWLIRHSSCPVCRQDL